MAEEFLFLFKVGALPVWGRRGDHATTADAIADAREVLVYMVGANRCDSAAACVGKGPTRDEASWFGEWRWSPEGGMVWSTEARPEPLSPSDTRG